MISEAQWEAMIPAFHDGYPREVVVAAFSDDSIEVIANTHHDPEDHFSISIADTQRLQRRYERGELRAFLHSHPKGQKSPSDADYLSQRSRERGTGPGWTYGIVAIDGDPDSIYEIHRPEFWGDAVDRGALEGRPYLWGIRDCFALVRDWYAAQGIYVPDAPRIRNPELYPQGSPYRDFFRTWIERCGFEEVVDRAQRQPGDAFTFASDGETPDHCGIYLGAARYLHHATDSLSKTKTLAYEEELLTDMSARFWRLTSPIPLNTRCTR